MTEAEQQVEAFPGRIGVTHLRVYDRLAPDGLAGGSPHMHFACSEAYLVIQGRGSVQTLSSAGFREITLRAGSMVWFTPGLIHRLVNADQLEIFAGDGKRRPARTWRLCVHFPFRRSSPRVNRRTFLR
jgi:mannose-6-phosphate isomerase-like protein (cupin superfamily)